MERASGLHDLPDDGKVGHRRGFEVRGSQGQIDRIHGGLGDDEVGIVWLAAFRERDDEVRDRPALLGREGFFVRRHGRAVEPRRHRPEDVLAGRPAPEGPALREVRRAYRKVQLVDERLSRRSVAPTKRPVALYAAVLHVELLPQLDRLCRSCRGARERHGLGGSFHVGEARGEGRQVVGEIRHLLVGQRGPRGHRGVGHAAPDDVDEVLMGRERSAGSRADLEVAHREFPGPGVQVRGGVPCAVTVLAVALRTVSEIERPARFPLRLGPHVLSRHAHRPHRHGAQRDDQDSETPAQSRDESHSVSTSSLARGLSPVKS